MSTTSGKSQIMVSSHEMQSKLLRTSGGIEKLFLDLNRQQNDKILEIDEKRAQLRKFEAEIWLRKMKRLSGCGKKKALVEGLENLVLGQFETVLRSINRKLQVLGERRNSGLETLGEFENSSLTEKENKSHPNSEKPGFIESVKQILIEESNTIEERLTFANHKVRSNIVKVQKLYQNYRGSVEELLSMTSIKLKRVFGLDAIETIVSSLFTQPENGDYLGVLVVLSLIRFTWQVRLVLQGIFELNSSKTTTFELASKFRINQKLLILKKADIKNLDLIFTIKHDLEKLVQGFSLLFFKTRSLLRIRQIRDASYKFFNLEIRQKKIDLKVSNFALKSISDPRPNPQNKQKRKLAESKKSVKETDESRNDNFSINTDHENQLRPSERSMMRLKNLGTGQLGSPREHQLPSPKPDVENSFEMPVPVDNLVMRSVKTQKSRIVDYVDIKTRSITLNRRKLSSDRNLKQKEENLDEVGSLDSNFTAEINFYDRLLSKSKNCENLVKNSSAIIEAPEKSLFSGHNTDMRGILGTKNIASANQKKKTNKNPKSSMPNKTSKFDLKIKINQKSEQPKLTAENKENQIFVEVYRNRRHQLIELEEKILKNLCRDIVKGFEDLSVQIYQYQNCGLFYLDTVSQIDNFSNSILRDENYLLKSISQSQPEELDISKIFIEEEKGKLKNSFCETLNKEIGQSAVRLSGRYFESVQALRRLGMEARGFERDGYKAMGQAYRQAQEMNMNMRFLAMYKRRLVLSHSLIAGDSEYEEVDWNEDLEDFQEWFNANFSEADSGAQNLPQKRSKIVFDLFFDFGKDVRSLLERSRGFVSGRLSVRSGCLVGRRGMSWGKDDGWGKLCTKSLNRGIGKRDRRNKQIGEQKAQGAMSSFPNTAAINKSHSEFRIEYDLVKLKNRENQFFKELFQESLEVCSSAFKCFISFELRQINPKSSLKSKRIAVSLEIDPVTLDFEIFKRDLNSKLINSKRKVKNCPKNFKKKSTHKPKREIDELDGENFRTFQENKTETNQNKNLIDQGSEEKENFVVGLKLTDFKQIMFKKSKRLEFEVCESSQAGLLEDLVEGMGENRDFLDCEELSLFLNLEGVPENLNAFLRFLKKWIFQI